MTAKKTRRNTSNLTPGNPGNSGGKKGRSGRPKAKTVEYLRGLLESPKVRKEIKDKAEAGDIKVIEMAMRYTEKPGTVLEVTGKDGGPISVESPTDRLRDELARIAERQRKGKAAQRDNPSTG